MSSKTFVIIVAAGTGSRFGSDIPKQFLPLGPNREPVLMHTVKAFLNSDFTLDSIFIVISEDMIDFWLELCDKHAFRSPKIVTGGPSRFHSVKNALNVVTPRDNDKVLVHDGVRPFVTPMLINQIVNHLNHDRAVVPGVPMVDSIRRWDDSKSSHTVNRNDYYRVQTPQGFIGSVICKAYKGDCPPGCTDDASLVERTGININTVQGDENNFKITNRHDLERAELVLQSTLNIIKN